MSVVDCWVPTSGCALTREERRSGGRRAWAIPRDWEFVIKQRFLVLRSVGEVATLKHWRLPKPLWSKWDAHDLSSARQLPRYQLVLGGSFADATLRRQTVRTSTQ